jgi:alkylhydroperoxidase family enzyme
MPEPWIHVIPEEVAEGRLKEIYDTICDKVGRVGKMMQIHSLNPDVVNGHFRQFMAVMFSRTDLARAEREMIAVVVSAENGCRY